MGDLGGRLLGLALFALLARWLGGCLASTWRRWTRDFMGVVGFFVCLLIS